MQALNVAAILLTGSACSVLLLQARNRLLICRIPALVIFLLLDLPLYGILLYLHADTAEALLRRAVLGGGFAIGCIVIALLFQRRKKALLSFRDRVTSAVHLAVYRSSTALSAYRAGKRTDKRNLHDDYGARSFVLHGFVFSLSA